MLFLSLSTGGYSFTGLWSHGTHERAWGWAGINRNWREGPAGSLWVGRREKCPPDSAVPPLACCGLCCSSLSFPSTHKTIRVTVRADGGQWHPKMRPWGSTGVNTPAVLIPAATLILWMGQKYKGSIQFLVNLNPHFQKRREIEWWMKMVVESPDVHIRQKACQLFGSLSVFSDDKPITSSVPGCKFMFHLFFSVWSPTITRFSSIGANGNIPDDC